MALHMSESKQLHDVKVWMAWQAVGGTHLVTSHLDGKRGRGNHFSNGGGGGISFNNFSLALAHIHLKCHFSINMH